MKTIGTVLLALTAALPAQRLHDAVSAADLVVVATDVGVRPSGSGFFLHKLQIAKTLKGEPRETVTVVEQKGVALHARPVPAESRLYCLHDFAREAKKAELPEGQAPYFKMNGHPGSNPAVGADPERDPQVSFARVVIEADAGLAPERVADRMLALALHGPEGLRTEAAQLLIERPAARDKLSLLQWSELMTRAVGEIEDVPHKITLAQLCAEKRLPGLVEELCRSIDQVQDERFAQALGRIARVVRGEQAHEALVPALRSARSPQARGLLALALGATSTDGALAKLLELKKADANDRFVDAALALHGARAALDAIGSKADSRPSSGR